MHAFLSFWGTIVVHPYLARGTGACPHPPHLQKTQVLAASNHNDLVQLSLLYIPKGFGWRGTTFRKYKTVTEHDDDDHEQPNNNNSTRFHSRAQGITLQPFPTLTLIKQTQPHEAYKSNPKLKKSIRNLHVVYADVLIFPIIL